MGNTSGWSVVENSVVLVSSLPLDALFVGLLATGLIIAQLLYSPSVETRWRRRLRWAFFLGTAIVIVLVIRRGREFL